MKKTKKLMTLLTAFVMMLSCFGFVKSGNNVMKIVDADAASVDYPVQLMNLASKDNSKVLTENGTADGSAVIMKALGNDLSPSWRFDRVGSDSKGTFFKLCNAQSGRLLTPQNYDIKAGTSVIMYGGESAQSQHWYVVPVSRDRLGNDLHYKIVNYSDTNLALTQNPDGMTLENYKGSDDQLFLLNADGLQGFAGYCANDNTGREKAADIGGLFGEVVEVGDFAALKKYAESDTPYTIIINNNISVTDLNLNGERYMCTAGRIYVRSNKTIIGSYGAHRLFNVQFCTNSGKGVGNNIIIKNLESTHDAESNNNDSIQFYFGSGQNIWVDHVTFVGHDNYGYAPKTGKVDEDKFLACCYDADYCTVSDSSFGAHKYGLILGYPDSSSGNAAKYDGYPRMTLVGNRFNDTNTRGPGLMRWGYYHSFNNYVNKFSMAYTVQANCRIYAENCYYTNGGNVICDWNLSSGELAGSYAESGSKFSNCSRTKRGEGTANNPSYAKDCTWRPTGNYSYVKLSADEAKTYCSGYSGCQTSSGDMMYLRFGKKGVPGSGFNTAPDGPMKPPAPVPETFKNGSAYRFKNVNSGLYMQVAGAAAENGANVQQWGSSDSTTHDIWKLIDAGEGYYYLAANVGDGGTYMLDVAGKKTANGTNIDIYNYNGGTNQQFMITKNDDGSYKLRTRITGEASAVEIANASTESGANVQQYEINGANCQDWIMEEVANPGCKMDTSVIYQFENLNSGMVMDIVNGTMADGTNVQQWGSNGFDCQKWMLKEFKGGGNYYYILSLADQKYALKADGSDNGGNIAIVPYSTNDSAMLFKFSRNPDGTYHILTRASKDARFVEVSGASMESGANVQQWDMTGSDCQKWAALTETTTTTTSTTTTTTTTTTATAPTTTAVPPAPVQGDINNDGKVDIADLVMLQKYLMGAEKFSYAQFRASDLLSDGRVDAYDLVILRRLAIYSNNK